MALLAFSAISGPGERASIIPINSTHRVFPVPDCRLSLGIGFSKLHVAGRILFIGGRGDGPVIKWTQFDPKHPHKKQSGEYMRVIPDLGRQRQSPIAT